MGPLADLRVNPESDDGPASTAVRWLDENKNDKNKLVTNKSEDDLIYKELVNKVEVHKNQPSAKPIMKPFKLNLAEVTGVHNLTSARQLLGGSSHRHTLSESDASNS